MRRPPYRPRDHREPSPAVLHQSPIKHSTSMAHSLRPHRLDRPASTRSDKTSTSANTRSFASYRARSTSVIATLQSQRFNATISQHNPNHSRNHGKFFERLDEWQHWNTLGHERLRHDGPRPSGSRYDSCQHDARDSLSQRPPQGLWRHPAQAKQDLTHWVTLAQTLEAAKFHGIFFADVLGLYDVYGAAHRPDNSDPAPALASGSQIPILDISLLISALAYATKDLSFGITSSTTFENPYALARKYATLDHLTDGRVGWNIVLSGPQTTYLESAAKSYGFQKLVEHDERYAMADEFMEVFYKLVEGSWEDDAVEANRATGVYANPAKVHKINHVGKYFSCTGPSLVEPSSQRTPYLLQAGASKAGKDFAAKHAEAMFLPGMVPAKTRQIIDEVRALLRANGRGEHAIKFIAGIFICVDETDAQAQAKFDDLLQYADLEGTASLFGGWTGTDLATFSDDEDFAFTGPPAIQSMIAAWTSHTPAGEKWTKRRVLQELAISGAHPRAVGSATTVADLMQRWVEEAGVDGFNISYATTPGTFEDIIRFLKPELERRGVWQREYAGKSMRENYAQDGLGPKLTRPPPPNRRPPLPLPLAALQILNLLDERELQLLLAVPQEPLDERRERHRTPRVARDLHMAPAHGLPGPAAARRHLEPQRLERRGAVLRHDLPQHAPAIRRHEAAGRVHRDVAAVGGRAEGGGVADAAGPQALGDEGQVVFDFVEARQSGESLTMVSKSCSRVSAAARSRGVGSGVEDWCVKFDSNIPLAGSLCLFRFGWGLGWMVLDKD
nr:dimethyl-sulfide monooxygenase [Quercus suber]